MEDKTLSSGHVVIISPYITCGGPLNRIDLGWYLSVLAGSASSLLLLCTTASPSIESCRGLAAIP